MVSGPVDCAMTTGRLYSALQVWSDPRVVTFYHGPHPTTSPSASMCLGRIASLQTLSQSKAAAAAAAAAVAAAGGLVVAAKVALPPLPPLLRCVGSPLYGAHKGMDCSTVWAAPCGTGCQAWCKQVDGCSMVQGDATPPPPPPPPPPNWAFELGVQIGRSTNLQAESESTSGGQASWEDILNHQLGSGRSVPDTERGGLAGK